MGRWGDGKPLSWGRLPPLREVAQPEGGDGEMVSHSRGSSPSVERSGATRRGRWGDGETRGQGEELITPNS